MEFRETGFVFLEYLLLYNGREVRYGGWGKDGKRPERGIRKACDYWVWFSDSIIHDYVGQKY